MLIAISLILYNIGMRPEAILFFDDLEEVENAEEDEDVEEALELDEADEEGEENRRVTP